MKLTTNQTIKLRIHARHHSNKHLETMKAAMEKGKSFKEAHNMAVTKVGK
ncbi:hypothetical protein LCGC14_1846950 [marine sediment metagenome]|uniref:Uncharacterized protein n=1 Tax=marine sediment metagenome TaxID=412755 RepID=A0A0F9GBR7_9ZZZZ